jgi:FkbM family methyltransferase
MNTPASSSTSISRWTQQLWMNCYFKFILPRIERTTKDQIQLDLTELPPKIRNRILNVGYEDAEREICREMLSAEDSVLELGGGIGFLGLFCQLRLGVKRYITVEANPATLKILKKNYSLNHVTPVVWNLALGPENGSVHLNIGGDFWEHHICKGKTTPNTVVVESATLPTLLAKTGFDVTALIIDIEGAEAYIDFSILPASIKKIIIEVHRENLSEQAVKHLFTSIRDQGFHTTHCKDTTFGFART